MDGPRNHVAGTPVALRDCAGQGALSNRATPFGVSFAPLPQDYGYTVKADIYSFGITALELINGVTPYHEWQSLQILLDKLDRPYPPLSGCKRGLSRSFYRMVAACLRKDPAQRFVARHDTVAAASRHVLTRLRRGGSRNRPMRRQADRQGAAKPPLHPESARSQLHCCRLDGPDHRHARGPRTRCATWHGLHVDRGRGAHASQRRPLGNGCRAAALAAAQQSDVQLDANGVPIGMNGEAAAPPPEDVYSGQPEAMHQDAALDAGGLGIVAGADDMIESGAGRRGRMFFIASPAGSPVADGLQVSADAAYPQAVPEWTL